jgi:cytochrome c-type protein NapC
VNGRPDPSGPGADGPAGDRPRRRRRWSWVAALPALAFMVLGAGLSGAGKAALDHTNTIEFCISCHEMKSNNFEEYSHTVHALNRTGVKAVCADCHVPHEFPDVLGRKIGAANDVMQHLLGRLDTKEQFESHRLELAQRVWLRMKQTDSRECRHCHDVTAMDADQQGRTARKQHARMAAEGKTCIDCHFGIAHREPVGGDPGDLPVQATRPNHQTDRPAETKASSAPSAANSAVTSVSLRSTTMRFDSDS